ncbi:hypothetical protein EG329_013432 [Mollisiaceae sp. DMI_Dod_QoI]|nr:hypothetical protein EG329_013432 [Helotiales sp. DMI_Dod_QoI]
MAHHQRIIAYSASNASDGPIPVPEIPRQPISDRKRTEDDHTRDLLPEDQYRLRIPPDIDAVFSTLCTPELVVPETIPQPNSQPTNRYLLSPGQPDMNDPFVLDLYTQLVKLQNDIVQWQLLFDSPDHSLQDLLHLLARKVGLEFEYSLSLRQVRISRISVSVEDALETVQRHRQAPELFCNDLGLNSIEAPGLDPTFVLDDINFLMPDIFAEDLSFPAEQDTPFDRPSWTQYSTSPSLLSGSIGGSLQLRSPEHHDDSTGIDPSLIVNDNNFSSTGAAIPENLAHTDQPRTPMPIPSVEHGDSIHQPIASGGRQNQTSQEATKSYIFVSDIDTKSRIRAVDKAAAKAVKAIGACWKCKVLRKKCDTNTPCQECQRGEKGSIWQDIGCRRGSIGSQFPTPYLCTNDVLNLTVSARGVKHRACNNCIELQQKVVKGCLLPSSFNGYSWDPQLQVVVHAEIPSRSGSGLESFCTSIFEEHTEYRGLMEKAATLASSDCWFSHYREVRRHFTNQTNSNWGCNSDDCTEKRAHELPNMFTQFFNALSKVMFQKKNMRGDKSWWLPVFSSLLIIAPTVVAMNSFLAGGSKYYHYLLGGTHLRKAIQLFGALSTNFDPLIRREESIWSSHLIEWLANAVCLSSWEINGVKSSADFLQRMFGMHGCELSNRKILQVSTRRSSKRGDSSLSAKEERPLIAALDSNSSGHANRTVKSTQEVPTLEDRNDRLFYFKPT